MPIVTAFDNMGPGGLRRKETSSRGRVTCVISRVVSATCEREALASKYGGTAD